MKAQKKQFKPIQTISASLYFLNQEAERQGLKEIASIIEYSIHAINDWIKNGNSGKKWKDWVNQELFDKDLYHVMSFVHKSLAFNPEDLGRLVTILEKHEKTLGKKGKVINFSQSTNKVQ